MHPLGELNYSFFAGQQNITSLDFSPDNKFLVSASTGKLGGIQIWPIRGNTNSISMEDKTEDPYWVGFGPEEDKFFSTSTPQNYNKDNYFIHIWNRNEAQVTLKRVNSQFEFIYHSPQFSQDAKKILGSVSPENTPIVWDTQTGEQLKIFTKENEKIKAFGFILDDSRVWVRTETTIKVYDYDSTALIWQTTGLTSDISLDRTKLAVLKKDGHIQILNTDDGSEIVSFPAQKNAEIIKFNPSASHIVSFNPDGYRQPILASNSENDVPSATSGLSETSLETIEEKKVDNTGGARVWNIQTQSLEFETKPPQHTRSNLINYNLIGDKLLIPWGSGKLKMYNIDEKRSSYTHEGALNLQLSSDGMLATSNLDSIDVFDFETGIEIFSINGNNPSKFNDQQTFLLTTERDKIILHELPYFLSAASHSQDKATILNASRKGKTLSKVQFQKIRHARTKRIFAMASKVVAYKKPHVMGTSWVGQGRLFTPEKFRR